MSTLRREVLALRKLDLIECGRDPAVFFERHLCIEDTQGQAIAFVLWPFQRRTLRQVHEGRRTIVLKARRLGLSWIALAYALWLAIFQQGSRVLILCKNERDAAEALDRVRRMRDRLLDDPLASHLLTGLEQAAHPRDAVMTLDVGQSVIRALAGTAGAARGETASLVVLDEFAFQPDAGNIWRAILPTAEGGGRIVCISTGNGAEVGQGIGAEFARQWSRASSGESGFTPLFWPWDARPDRDEAWRQRTLAELGDEERFSVEYPGEPADAFLSPDADLLYDTTHLSACAKRGTEYDALDWDQRPGFGLWIGIDWGVNTHFVIGRRTAGGGLYLIAEAVDRSDDMERSARALFAVLDPILAASGDRVCFIRFDSSEPKLHATFMRLYGARYGSLPRSDTSKPLLGVPFNKYKRLSIKYLRALSRRTYEGEQMRALAISPTGCPVLLGQMATQEWKDADAGKTEKGNDHGGDATITLAAELAEEFYSRLPG